MKRKGGHAYAVTPEPLSQTELNKIHLNTSPTKKFNMLKLEK